jgi:hypothetical protein
LSSAYFSTDFESLNDADAVANLFANMIHKVDLTPELSKKATDFTGFKIRNKNVHD